MFWARENKIGVTHVRMGESHSRTLNWRDNR